MTKEERKILLKDLSARLPYGVKAQVQGWDEAKEEEVNIPLKVYSINTDGYVYFESNDYDVNYCPIENCLLYLRPMSSMDDEEKKEFDEFVCIDEFAWNGNAEKGYPNQASIMSDGIDWLLEHHFDYRGLIEKGLALEAPKDMYKEK